jgi:hypothetical protein
LICSIAHAPGAPVEDAVLVPKQPEAPPEPEELPEDVDPMVDIVDVLIPLAVDPVDEAEDCDDIAVIDALHPIVDDPELLRGEAVVVLEDVDALSIATVELPEENPRPGLR